MTESPHMTPVSPSAHQAHFALYSIEMKKPSRRAQRYLSTREQTSGRERLARRWHSRMHEAPEFAALVTAEHARQEPFHRWLHYKQGYSPALVRAFLKENAPREENWSGPILDPFSGSGTCVIECGRQNVPAIGIEAIPSLAFLTNCAFKHEFPPLSDTALPSRARKEAVREVQGSKVEVQNGERKDSPCAHGEPRTSGRAESRWETIAAHLDQPLHRAALMLAVSRQCTSAGKPNRGAKTLQEILVEVTTMIEEDLRKSIPQTNSCIIGDAREMRGVPDHSIGGVLTSPPYLSRHNYQQITRAYESVYLSWHASDLKNHGGRSGQLQANAHTATHGISMADIAIDNDEINRCMDEISNALESSGQKKWINTMHNYFADMGRVLSECRRVLIDDAPCWIVIGGARLGDVYVPADLMIAELAENSGFHVSEIRVARDLVTSRRKFGNSGYVAPRESILILTLNN